MATSIFADMTREGHVAVAFWPKNDALGLGIHATAHLSPDEAQLLVMKVQAALARIPRVGTAADLGCEVLP